VIFLDLIIWLAVPQAGQSRRSQAT